MPPRSRPRYHNVRTGCTTCKSRKVKCSEERPYCHRCIRGGFSCAGYQPPPKAWIFHGSPQAQKSADKTRSALSNNILPANSRELAQRAATSPCILGQSPLQHGNSDPFNCYAIPLGPHEIEILQIFQRSVTPPRPSRLMDAVVREIKESYRGSLTEQATAYALFARNVALQNLMRSEHCKTPSTLSLNYMVRSQAALRQRLQSVMSGSMNSYTIQTVMCAATYLAATDIITGDASAQYHIHALRRCVAHYVESVGDNLETTAISSLLYMDNLKALATLSRPVLNPDHWSPYLFQDLHDAGRVSRASSNDSELAAESMHRDVRDETLQTIILSHRAGLTVYHSLLGADIGSKKTKALITAVRGRELLRNNQLLNVLADALESLRKRRLSPEQVQDQSARVYLSFSIFLWSQLASPTTITLYTPFDLTSSTLRHLKNILTRSRAAEESSPCHEKMYAEARLWALFVGVCTELNRQDILGPDLICGDWFFETFRDEANSLRVHSWQHAVTIFEQFLHDERMEPQISRWWYRVAPNDDPTDEKAG